MTKIALTLAAALLAGTTLSNAANAGGIRLGFGMPLGSFVAHSNQSYNSKPSSGYGEKKCAKKAAPARHYVKHTAPKKIEVAEEAPVRHIKKAVKAPVAIQTATLEDKSVISDAAPSIVVPESPPAAEVAGTQSTPAIETATVTTETAAVVTEEVKAEPAKVETAKVETEEPKRKINLTSEAKRVCRRFSAAIAGLIDVPCE